MRIKRTLGDEQDACNARDYQFVCHATLCRQECSFSLAYLEGMVNAAYSLERARFRRGIYVAKATYADTIAGRSHRRLIRIVDGGMTCSDVTIIFSSHQRHRHQKVVVINAEDRCRILSFDGDSLCKIWSWQGARVSLGQGGPIHSAKQHRVPTPPMSHFHKRQSARSLHRASEGAVSWHGCPLTLACEWCPPYLHRAH